MSVRSSQSEQEAQEDEDGQRVCAALDRLLTEAGVSTREIERRTGIPEANTRRWRTGKTVPSLQSLARLERVLGLSVGTTMSIAFPDDREDIRYLLATDPNLHQSYRRQARETYDLWVRLSQDERAR